MIPIAGGQDRAVRDGSETADPVSRLLLTGEAATLDEAEELYLDSSLEEIVRLVRSPLSEEAFRRHPLIALLLARGSRGFEDSLV